MKKAYIDRSNSELIVIGWDPYWSRKQMLALGLKSWAWIDSDDRAIPDSWEAIEVLDEEQPYNNSMNEKQKVWVVWEAIEDKHFDCTNTSFNIVGVYSNETMAKEVSYRSIKYSIEEVEFNK